MNDARRMGRDRIRYVVLKIDRADNPPQPTP
jgi:hypothetical protein